MVRPNDGDNRIGKVHALENLGAYYRVDLHLFELFRRQPTRLVDDVLGNGQLADVMQQGCGPKRL